MKIIFVCKHNRFRSKVAEAIFNKLNKNPKVKAESRGILLDELRPYIEKNVIKIMNEKGYQINGKPEKLAISEINNYDLLIIVANNIDKEFFNKFKGKIIKWDIEDCNANNINKIKSTVNEIENKVKDFLKYKLPSSK